MFAKVSLLCALLVPAFVRGAPVARSSAPVGALFFITNEADGNNVLSANIGQDGTLTNGNAVSAGGSGAHALGLVGPGALLSQASVQVSGNNLVTVNGGSNTVSLFSIDSQNPSQLTLVGNPVGSGGEFPASVTVDKNSGNVCVLNGGSVNGVSCFKQDSATGLTAIPNTTRSLGLNQTTPATGPPKSATQVLFSEDGKRLFASVKGAPGEPGFIATWDINQDDFSLSDDFAKTTPPQGAIVCGMTLINGGEAIFNSDALVGFNVFRVNDGDVSSAVQTVQTTPIDGQKGACWTQFSKVTGTFWTTDIVTSTLTEVALDLNTLDTQSVKQTALTSGSAPADQKIVSIGEKDFLYVLTANQTSIQVFDLQRPGQALNIQTFDIAQMAEQLNVKISPDNLIGMDAFF